MSRPPDLSASLVQKGQAAPVSPDAAMPPAAGGQGASQLAPAISEPPLAAPPVARPHRPSARRVHPSQPEVDPPDVEPRVVVTIRVKESINEGIRELSYKRRWKKQHIFDMALAEYLDRNPPEA